MQRDNLFGHLWRQVCELDLKRQAAWAAMQTPDEVTARQSWVREQVLQMIGPFPERCDLNPRVVGGFERDDYRVETILFDSRPRFPVTATLYLPPGDGPFPAILSPCGHSANGRMIDTYQTAHIAFVKQGFAVLTYDPVSQGERLQYLDASGKPLLQGCCHEHCMAGNQLNLTGSSFANIRVWDGIRALDFLVSRPEVDASRVGVTGNSGGGTLSAWLLCIDERFAAGAPSCFITTLVHRIKTRSAADSEQQFVPMLKLGIDHPDMLLPVAPKPLLISAAIKDFFPIEGARQTVEDLRRIYGILGAPDDVDIVTADEPHGWSVKLREGCVAWFKKHLQGDQTPYSEPLIQVEEEATLYATETGQVMTSEMNAAQVHDIVVRDSPMHLQCHDSDEPEAMVIESLRELLAIEPAQAKRPWPLPEYATVAPVLPPLDKGVRAEQVRFLSDFDVVVQGVLLRPAQATREAVVVVPDEAGIAPLLARGSAASRLAAAGRAVLAIDPRGVGADLGPTPGRIPAARHYDFYGIEVDLTYTSWMIGKPLLGQRVYDVLCAVQWLRERGYTVAVEGYGVGGLMALFAAALEPDITAVGCHGMLLSYANLFVAEIYEFLPNILIPNLLLHCDLPDIAATIAPRPLALTEPVDATRRPVRQALLEAEYTACRRAYEARGAGQQLRLIGA